MNELEAMSRLIEALRPWLGQLVIVGGWAHRLHRFHSMASPLPYLSLQTGDADIAFSSTEHIEGDIGAALKVANFREELTGAHIPSVAHYSLGRDDGGFYAEFLTPLHGRGYKRNGAPDATLAKAGVTAQKLRHLELLLVDPFTVRLDSDVGVRLTSPADAKIANPVSFIAQKLLIQPQRTPKKRAQDILYIHDTLELFGGELERLKWIWLAQVRPTLPQKTAQNIVQLQREQFRVVTDSIREAVRIPADRTLTPARLRAACEYGLDQVFGAE